MKLKRILERNIIICMCILSTQILVSCNNDEKDKTSINQEVGNTSEYSQGGTEYKSYENIGEIEEEYKGCLRELLGNVDYTNTEETDKSIREHLKERNYTGNSLEYLKEVTKGLLEYSIVKEDLDLLESRLKDYIQVNLEVDYITKLVAPYEEINEDLTLKNDTEGELLKANLNEMYADQIEANIVAMSQIMQESKEISNIEVTISLIDIKQMVEEKVEELSQEYDKNTMLQKLAYYNYNHDDLKEIQEENLKELGISLYTEN